MVQMNFPLGRTFFYYPFEGKYFSWLEASKCSSRKKQYSMKKNEISHGKKLGGMTLLPSQ